MILVSVDTLRVPTCICVRCFGCFGGVWDVHEG